MNNNAIKAIFTIFSLLQTIDANNYDSILKTDPLAVSFSIDTFIVYKKMPFLIRIEPKISWPSFGLDISTATLENTPREELSYHLQLNYVTTPDYELLSKFPPPISIEISNKKTINKKIKFNSNAYEFHKVGFPEDFRFEDFPEFYFKPDMKYFTYVDLRPFIFDLDTGNYKATISYKSSFYSSFEYKRQFQFKINGISDPVSNVLWRYLPEYMEQAGLDENAYDYSLIFYYYIDDEKEIGLPIIRQKLVNYPDLQKKLPKDIFSQLSPYLFFNFVYNRCTVTENGLKLLNNFPEILKPLAASLKYEIAFLQKDKDAEKLKKEIQKQYPGEAWRLEKIDKNNGIIQYLIKMGKAGNRSGK